MAYYPKKRYNRKTYRKRYARKRRQSFYKGKKKASQFKILRWSSADATNNCHVQHVGNDTVPSGELATLFSMSHVNGSGELVSLFDNFRVLKVLYRWVLVRNPDQATTATFKGIYPRVVWTHDFNDSAPISRTLIYQRSNLKEFFFGDNMQKSKWYSIKPAVLTQMYESSTATAYQPTWRKWLDTGDNATPHYGIKYSYDNLYAGITIRMEAKILMECKGIS